MAWGSISFLFVLVAVTFRSKRSVSTGVIRGYDLVRASRKLLVCQVQCRSLPVAVMTPSHTVLYLEDVVVLMGLHIWASL